MTKLTAGSTRRPRRSGRRGARALLVLLAVAGRAPAQPVSVAIATADGASVELRMDSHTPPGRLIDLGSHRLHLLCTGQGEPTVVLEAGLGGFSLEWLPLHRELSRQFRVCSYDRAGYGWSDPGPAPRTTQRLVMELSRLLETAGETAPYLLVGHSFGGYTVQYFAKVHPLLTAGIVLVDSSHPDQFNRFPRSQRDLFERLTRGRQIALDVLPELPANYPETVRSLALSLMQTPKARRAQRLEYRSFRKSGEQVLAAGRMPDVPAAVLSRAEREWPATVEGDAMEALWPVLQADLAHTMPHARQSVVAGSGHHVHLDRPAAVADAIRTVAGESRCAGMAGANRDEGGSTRQC
ncbi:MAG: alpha/beta fold hydrolase [Chromatiales bacterium]